MSIHGEQWAAGSGHGRKGLCTEIYMCQRLLGTHARRVVVDSDEQEPMLSCSERGSPVHFHGRWLDLLITRISFGYPVDVLPSLVDTPASGPGWPDYAGSTYGIRLVRPAGANCHAHG